MKSKKEFLDYLTSVDIEYKNYDHEPVFTVEDAEKVCNSIPGAHCKNLFLKEIKKSLSNL